MWPVCYQFTIGGVSLNGQRSTATVTFYSTFAADVTLVIQVGFVCSTVLKLIFSQTLKLIALFSYCLKLSNVISYFSGLDGKVKIFKAHKRAN